MDHFLHIVVLNTFSENFANCCFAKCCSPYFFSMPILHKSIQISFLYLNVKFLCQVQNIWQEISFFVESKQTWYNVIIVGEVQYVLGHVSLSTELKNGFISPKRHTKGDVVNHHVWWWQSAWCLQVPHEFDCNNGGDGSSKGMATGHHSCTLVLVGAL